MAITHKYTLLCDDIRQENNGKFLILGLYTPDIVVPIVPFAMPGISFFSLVEADAIGPVDLSFRLTQGETIISGGSGKMAVAKTGTTAIPLKLGGLVFPTAGRYRFVLDIEGSGEVIHEFSVVLSLPGLGQPAPPRGVH